MSRIKQTTVTPTGGEWRGRIYIGCNALPHDAADVSCVPLQLGSAVTLADLGHALRDDWGDSISSRYTSYGSLTGLYWVWKNAPHTDFIGFECAATLEKSARGRVTADSTSSEIGKGTKSKASDIDVFASLKRVDLLVPASRDVREDGFEDVAACLSSMGCYAPTLSLLRDILIKQDGACRKIFDSVFNGHRLPANIAVSARAESFAHFCNWLFSILFAFDDAQASSADCCNLEALGRLLLPVYVMRYGTGSKALRIREIDTARANHEQRPAGTVSVPTVAPVFDSSRTVPVVMSFNDSYCKYAAALFVSIVRAADKSRKYDLIVLSSDISEENKLRLRSLFAGLQNFALRFVNVESHFHDWQMPVYGQFSKETYYRLKIPDIFPLYDRIIYLDADTIVLRDLGELFDVDLGGMAAGVTRDIVMAGFRQQMYRARAECGGATAEHYLVDYLGMKDPAAYFQAGVMVLDVRKLRNRNFVTRAEQCMQKKQYWFLDQDVLNSVLEGDTRFMDGRWNALFGNDDLGTFFARLNDTDRHEFFRSLKDAYILHFAGDKKPWLRPDVPFTEAFWRFARLTPYYEELVTNSALSAGRSKDKVPQKLSFYLRNGLNYVRRLCFQR